MTKKKNPTLNMIIYEERESFITCHIQNILITWCVTKCEPNEEYYWNHCYFTMYERGCPISTPYPSIKVLVPTKNSPAHEKDGNSPKYATHQMKSDSGPALSPNNLRAEFHGAKIFRRWFMSNLHFKTVHTFLVIINWWKGFNKWTDFVY